MKGVGSDRRVPLIPASFFGIVLGLAGLANAWHAAHVAWSLPAVVGDTIFAAAAAVWAIIVGLYALKWLVAPHVARAELGDALQCCFVGLAGVATLLVAQGASAYSRPAGIALFLPGAAFTFAFGIWRTGHLWRGDRDPAATTPVLYLPLVAGGFVTGTVAASLGFPQWGQLAFGAAFFTWLAIESIILHRLYTAPGMAPALRPTLGIQLAPPAVGASCYLAISGGHPGLMAHMLIGYALVQALILLRVIGWIMAEPFGASYWAFTFGGTALAGAAIRLSTVPGESAVATLAPALFVLANILVLAIAGGTIRLLLAGRLLAAPPAEGP